MDNNINPSITTDIIHNTQNIIPDSITMNNYSLDNTAII